MGTLRGTAASSVAVLVLLFASLLQGQAPPATPLTLISREGRRPVPTTLLNGQELIALEDVATIFQASVRDDAAAGGVTLTYRGRTIVVSANQAMASVNGRVVALPSPVVRSGRRWLVPVEFLQSALGQIYDQRLQVRRASRLVLLGDVRVPRVIGRIDTPGPPTRATIDVTPATPITVAVENGRVTMRLDADALDLALPAAGGGLIAQLRAGDQPNTLVAVLDAGAGTARAIPQTTGTATRVIIEVQASGPATAQAPDTAPPGTPPVPSGPPVDPEALLAPRAVLRTIVIDPGHGGEEVGVRGARLGLEEKQVTIDVARRLRMLLEMRLGVRVILTREGDTAVGADVRAAIANNNKGDLFVSLHANAAPSPKVAGAEVYYLQLDQEGETVRKQASDGGTSIPVLGGGTRRLDMIPWDLAQARHVDDSAELAKFIAEELGRTLVMGASPIRRAPLRLLEGLNMPAALVEMAYLTNPEQEKLVATEDYRNAVAQALYSAIVRFRVHLEERRGR